MSQNSLEYLEYFNRIVRIVERGTSLQLSDSQVERIRQEVEMCHNNASKASGLKEIKFNAVMAEFKKNNRQNARN